MSRTGHSLEHWKSLASKYTTAQIIEERKSLKKKTHGRARGEMKVKCGGAVKKQHDRFTSGQFKGLIATITERQRPIYDMETLQLEADRELIEKTALHTNLTEFFTPLFSGTPEANTGFHSSIG